MIISFLQETRLSRNICFFSVKLLSLQNFQFTTESRIVRTTHSRDVSSAVLSSRRRVISRLSLRQRNGPAGWKTDNFPTRSIGLSAKAKSAEEHDDPRQFVSVRNWLRVTGVIRRARTICSVDQLNARQLYIYMRTVSLARALEVTRAVESVPPRWRPGSTFVANYSQKKLAIKIFT